MTMTGLAELLMFEFYPILGRTRPVADVVACFGSSIRAPVNCLSLTPLAFYRRALSNSVSLLDIPVHDASLLAAMRLARTRIAALR